MNTSANNFIVRSTLLRTMASDPSLGAWMIEGGKVPVSGNMQLGSVAHMLLLEPERFDSTFVVYEGRRGTNEYKKILEKYDKEFIVKESVYQTACEMVSVAKKFLDSNRCPKRLKELFENGKREETLRYTDEESRCTLQIKPDCYDSRCFMDYKTTSIPCPDLHMWKAHVGKYRTSLQLGYYSFVFGKLGSEMADGAYHLVQSTVAPYCVRVFFFDIQNLKKTYPDVEGYLASVELSLIELEKENVNSFDLSNFSYNDYFHNKDDYDSLDGVAVDGFEEDAFGLDDFVVVVDEDPVLDLDIIL